jgi:6,7-dimethyl-8-ribityllumazine synthase
MNEFEGTLEGVGKRFALIVSRFNGFITHELLHGAVACLVEHGVEDNLIDVYHVPGAWEIPQAARRLVALDRHDALIGLGCVIRGETPHFDFVAGEAAQGLGRLAAEATVPLVFGVLTTDTVEQAVARAGPKSGNKGREAALSALEMVSLFDRIR